MNVQKIVYWLASAALMLVMLVGASPARAQCIGAWQPLGTGMNSNVMGVTTWDPDGAGPLEPQIVAGGLFTTAGGASRVRIARWDGSAWQPFGTGINSTVRALTVYNGELVAGGDFDQAGGVGANKIAHWNGAAWSPFGDGMNELVYAVTVYNGELVAGGQFDRAGTVWGVNKIARWDGSAWQRVGPGFSDWVRALTVYNGELVAGGDFLNIDMGATVNRIARWDGSAWQGFGTGMNGQVYALTTWDPDGDGPLAPQLVAGGGFTTAGDVTVNRIARWDGSAWQPFGTGTGMNSNVLALTTWDPDGDGPAAPQLVAGGIFTTAEGVTVNCVTRWDGSAWQPFGTGMDNNRQVFALTTWDPDGAGPLARNLVVGGGFTFANDVSGFNRIASYTPATSAAPSISAQPQNATACAAGTATFSVTAAGTAPLSYQWRRNGQNISDGPAPGGGTFSGTATATLTINSVGLADAAQYDCVVTNVCGSVTSNSATLTVFPSGSGDGNASGTTDGEDINGFVTALLEGGPPSASYCAYDMNADGVVDLLDVPLFVDVLLGP